MNHETFDSDSKSRTNCRKEVTATFSSSIAALSGKECSTIRPGLPRTLEKGGTTISGGITVSSSTIHTSFTMARGDITQSFPILTFDPIDAASITQLLPMRV
mmetsp:Transcript_13399/g.19167  ORF Transcript_13399/g.19167 Transcript_13399/m.19167 type:complete len:102 (-) Transcript_13399:391-696(-)